MGYFKATIEVLVEAECEASACDAVSEGLRPILREFVESGESNLIDWRYAPNGDPEPSEGEGFEYGPAAPAHPSSPQVDWTNADEDAARAEGWAIYDADGGLEIEKNDTSDAPYEGAPEFKDDAEALAHVERRAAAGSELHRRALEIHRAWRA